MLERIVGLAIDNRGVILVAALAVLVSGFFIVPRLPIDAVPDVTNTQVAVLTDAPGLSAEQVERFVTVPVEMGLNGLPHLEEMRSTTRGGLSAVTLVFRDGTDVWLARQLTIERLREIEGDLPPTAGTPQLAPLSTGLGEIYQFVLRSDRHTPMELRTTLQWDVAPRLRQVPGVIEVNAMGGAAKEFHVVVDPNRLAAHGLSLGQVLSALERNNAAVGGGWIERGAEQQVIRGESQLRTLEDIGAVVVSANDEGTPVLVRHLGEVVVGQALPYGVVTRDGEGEAVTAIVMMRLGANSRDVVRGVHERIEEVRAELPEGMEIDVVYDRASFIDRTLRTVAHQPGRGRGARGHRAAGLPRQLAGSGPRDAGHPLRDDPRGLRDARLGITGNLMSLGAIDFGLLVDGPIVMLEAVIARLALHGDEAERAGHRRDGA
jgi:cobalt-zinc-cadmium resistance protein CzcA